MFLYWFFKPCFVLVRKKNAKRISYKEWCDLDRLKEVYFQYTMKSTPAKKNVKFEYVQFKDGLKLHVMVWRRPQSSKSSNKKVMIFVHGSGSSSFTSFGSLVQHIGYLHFNDVDEIHCIDLPGFAFSTFPSAFKKKAQNSPGRRRRRCCMCCWCCCCRPDFSSPDGRRAGEIVRDALAESLLRYIRTKILNANEILLLGHSIGSHIIVETARLDVQTSNQSNRKTSISKVVLMSPAGVLPTVGGSGSLFALAFHLAIPIRQGKFILRTSFGKRFMYELFESIGMSSLDMIQWRVRFEPSAWISDLPSWSVSMRYSSAKWIDPSLNGLLEAARTIPFALLTGEDDPICRISYVEKVAECIWPESCSREIFTKGSVASRKDRIGFMVDKNSTTSNSRKDSTVAPMIVMKDCGHSIMNSPLPQFLCALDMSIRNARVQDAVSIRFARLLKDVRLNDDVEFHSPFDTKGSNVVQNALHRRLSDRLDAARSLDLSDVEELSKLTELDDDDVGISNDHVVVQVSGK